MAVLLELRWTQQLPEVNQWWKNGVYPYLMIQLHKAVTRLFFLSTLFCICNIAIRKKLLCRSSSPEAKWCVPVTCHWKRTVTDTPQRVTSPSYLQITTHIIPVPERPVKGNFRCRNIAQPVRKRIVNDVGQECVAGFWAVIRSLPADTKTYYTDTMN